MLIVSMTGGFGHLRAGQALLDYAKNILPDVDVEHVDLIDIDPSLKKYATKAYDFASKKMSFLWRWMYEYPLFSFLAKKIVARRWASGEKITRYILVKSPDAIIFTNVAMVPSFIDRLRTALPKSTMGVAVTDYHGHAYYRIFGIDYYFVANSRVLQDLQKAGVAKEKIVITGIPIDPKFYTAQDLHALKIKHGIKNTDPVVLLVASFRISKEALVGVVKNLMAFRPSINVIFLANKNKEFYNAIKENIGLSERLLLVEWTDVMDEYMKIADVVICKAGGLTVSECLALKKPMIMLSPIPGQEEHNAEFVQKNNLGIKVDRPDQIIKVLPDMIVLGKTIQLDLVVQENPSKKIFQYMLKQNPKF